MTVNFHTNIDCCRKFMPRISGLPLSCISPNVDDLVLVYHDTGIEVWLKVVRRKWRLTGQGNDVLLVELHLPDYMPTIETLENHLRRTA